VLREFDVIHKKELKPKSTHVQVDLKRKKIYLRKDGPGFGKDIYFLYGVAEVYFRFYNRQNVTKGDILDLAKQWYSQIYSDLAEED
jgi:hypothetical protein